MGYRIFLQKKIAPPSTDAEAVLNLTYYKPI